MENHFDRTIVFSTESEFQSLYSWSLQEQDAEGKKIGRDWIPWSWNLYFKAKDISLRDHWKTDDRYPVDESKGKRETIDRRFIRASLYPDETDRRSPSYSMLGTSRTMSKFDLVIEVIDDDKEERCTTYGIVSYTTEIDFRDVTDDDSLTIYFWVHRATFDRYAAQVASGQVDGLTVRLSGVSGFYSDWSPGITTDKIRVLTSDKDHAVQSLKEGFPLPRLGEVNEGKLYFIRETKFPEPVDDEIEEVEPFTIDDEPVVDRAAQREVVRDNRSAETVKLLTSLRNAAWVIAALLLFSLFK